MTSGIYTDAQYEECLIEALAQYDLDVINRSLLAHSEKRVYRVHCATDDCLVSLYAPREGDRYLKANARFFAPASIRAELRILKTINDESPGIRVPSPIPAKSGDVIAVSHIGNQRRAVFVRATDYLPGRELSTDDPDYPDQCFEAGALCARLHEFSAHQGPGFAKGRPAAKTEYVRSLLDAMEDGARNGRISEGQIAAIRRGISIILHCMDRLDEEGETGLVHTDIRAANLLTDGTSLSLIDFSRSVIGYPLYDLGEMCMHMGAHAIQIRILKGYASVRRLSRFHLFCVQTFALMFLFDVCAEFVQKPVRRWLDDNLPLFENFYVPGLEQGGFLPRDLVDAVLDSRSGR